jgi:Mn2+/Fe2+ NRAMP family transporter
MKRRQIFEIGLGVATSVGGFLDVGSIATSLQAGAEFRFQLLWTVAFGTLVLVFLTEMSGRFSAVSQQTLVDAVRERFGANVFAAVLIGVGLSSLIVLSAEIIGTCVALQLATGISFRWWAVPVAFVAWLFLWKTTFGWIHTGIALLALVTVAFVVAAFRLHPSIGELGAGLVPGFPSHTPAHAAFLAVSILGASLTPYLFYFYSSGTIEDRWDASYLTVNRVSAVGMAFGGVVAAGVLVVAALVLAPRGIHVESLGQAADMLTPAFGRWGFPLFVASLAIGCFGAALEVSLTVTYMTAQGLGWNWGENVRPKHAARFATLYTAIVALATIPALLGMDAIALTNIGMALSAAVLPLLVLPFLILMNDPDYVHEHTNHWVTNGVVLVATLLAFTLAVVAIPLQIAGG